MYWLHKLGSKPGLSTLSPIIPSAQRSSSRSGSESDHSVNSSDSEGRRRRNNWPETEDDWKALYDDEGPDPFGRDVPRDKPITGKPLTSWDDTPNNIVKQDTANGDANPNGDNNFGLGEKVPEGAVSVTSEGEFNVMVDDNVIDWQCLEQDTQTNTQPNTQPDP